MNETGVSSLNGLIEQLYEESWQEDLGRFRSHFAFRGLSDARWDLGTTLVRVGGGGHAPKVEAHLLRNFRKYAHRDAAPGDSWWNWLALAQHHRLPTRLLDWTYSPFVAMHFVTAEMQQFALDGVIWCVDYVRTHHLLPKRLQEILDEEGSQVFTVDMLEKAAPTLHDFDALDSEPFAVFFEPPSLDERIVNQFALFSVMSNPAAMLNQWLAEHPELFRRVIIPASLKWEIRDKLDQANITERVMFPGLDGLADWLKRHYSSEAKSPAV